MLKHWFLFSTWLALVVGSEQREQEQSEVDYDAIAHRLRQEVVRMIYCHPQDEFVRYLWRFQFFLQLDQAGKLQRKVADLVSCCFVYCGIKVNCPFSFSLPRFIVVSIPPQLREVFVCYEATSCQ